VFECVEARPRVKEQWQRAACRAVADRTAEPSVLSRSRKGITWHVQLREIDAEAGNLTEEAQTLVAKAQGNWKSRSEPSFIMDEEA